MKQDNICDYAVIPDDVHRAYVEAVYELKEDPVVKRKVSLALVFALMIVLLAGVAFAIVSWHQHAERIAQMEAEQGYYFEWSADNRVALVQHLVDGGILTADERVHQLLNGGLGEEEASQLATAIITEWSGIREDAISLMSILETVWGRYPYEWSQEDLVWYMETLEANGVKMETRVSIPEGDVLTKEQAIALAVEYVKPLVNYPQEVWDSYTITAIYESQYYAGNDDPYWNVEFHPPTRWTTRTYIPGVVIDPRTGEVYSDEFCLTPEQRLIAHWEEIETAEDYRFMRFLTHEERAEATKGYPVGSAYAIPDPAFISEEEALSIAKKAFMEEREYTEEQLDVLLTAYTFYHADFGGGRPVWTVRYYDETVRLPDSDLVLGVDIYADTGKIISYYPWEY